MISIRTPGNTRGEVYNRIRCILTSAGYDIYQDYRIIIYPTKLVVDSFLGKEDIDVLLALSL